MSQRVIKNREDIYLLVSKFYDTIREDDILGPIFEFHIADNEWGDHIEKLTDFWLTNLFGVRSFKGNPTSKHINVDNSLDDGIEKSHFDRWLYLWFMTVDSLYDCERAERAKFMARKMASAQHISIVNHRNKYL